MPISAESRRRLDAGFQRRVDEQRRRYAGRWADAERLAAGLGYGKVIGIFGMEERADEFGGSVLRYGFWAMLPFLIGFPLLIAAAMAKIRGTFRLIIALPFVTGAWFLAVTLWAHRKKDRAWLLRLRGRVCDICRFRAGDDIRAMGRGRRPAPDMGTTVRHGRG
jgi:hypothetical protein